MVFADLHGKWRNIRVEVDECLDAGASTVVLSRYAGTHDQTGRSMEAILAHVYDVQDRRIKRCRQFTNTVPIVEAERSSTPVARGVSSPRKGPLWQLLQPTEKKATRPSSIGSGSTSGLQRRNSAMSRSRFFSRSSVSGPSPSRRETLLVMGSPPGRSLP